MNPKEKIQKFIALANESPKTAAEQIRALAGLMEMISLPYDEIQIPDADWNLIPNDLRKVMLGSTSAILIQSMNGDKR